jgi:hypothetical protein
MNFMMEKDQTVFVVGQVDGDEKVALLHDPIPVEIQQCAAVPYLVECALHVCFLYQEDVSVIVGIVGTTRRGVFRMSLLTSSLTVG